jgi:hypothetical protein
MINIVDEKVKDREMVLAFVPSLMAPKSPVSVIQASSPTLWSKLVSSHQRWSTSISESKDGLALSCNEFKIISETQFIDLYVLSRIKQIRRFGYKTTTISTLDAEAKRIWGSFKGSPISIRRNRFLLSVNAIFLDFDNASMPYIQFSDVSTLFKRLHITHLGYSSYSCSIDKPKYRVIIPYSRPVDSDIHYTAASLILHMLRGIEDEHFRHGQLDLSCIEPLRFFYTPKSRPDYSAWVHSYAGSFLSPEKTLLTIKLGQLKGLTIRPYSYLKKLVVKK